MPRLEWDKSGERYYEMGTSRGVLYPAKGTAYDTGVAWNGLTAVNESPEGAEATDLWADDTKYATFRSAEKFKGTIEAYTYPEEFEECDGTKEIAPGITVGQQGRKAFGLCYRSAIGSDVDIERSQYKLHLVYGCTASPSEKSRETINDSPDAITFSWEFETTPVNVPIEGFKPTALLEIDSRRVSAENLKKLEDKLYGTAETEPTLLLPAEVIALIGVEGVVTASENADNTATE